MFSGGTCDELHGEACVVRVTPAWQSREESARAELVNEARTCFVELTEEDCR
jgi:hypothetical protein